MRAVIQRSRDASCVVAGKVTGEFHGSGLVVLVGVTHTDTVEHAAKMARKIANLRLFDSPESAATAGRGAEVSALSLGLPVLLISQFTLYGETRKGNRPTWVQAAPGAVAQPLIQELATQLEQLGLPVEQGIFGADMQITSTNDGPFTVLVEI